MTKSKITKKNIIIAIAVVIILVLLVIGVLNFPTNFRNVGVEVVTNGTTYELPSDEITDNSNCIRWYGSDPQPRRDEMMYIRENLSDVEPIKTPFTFNIKEEDILRGAGYTLYTDVGKIAYEHSVDFIMPSEKGKYWCVVKVTWGNNPSWCVKNQVEKHHHYLHFEVE